MEKNQPKKYFGTICISDRNEEKTGYANGRQNHAKNRHCLRGVDGKHIQWNEILRDILNGKLNIIQSRKRKSESESESEEIDKERDFKMENPDTF